MTIVGTLITQADGASPWDIKSTDSGRFSLSFDSQTVLSLACPSIKVDGSKTAISMCAAAHYSKAILTNKTRSVDPTLGAYTEQRIIYTPISTDSAGPRSQLIFQAFDAPLRVVQIRMVFDRAVHTNWICPLEGSWFIGSGTPKEPRFLRVPQDNDVQSSYASVSTKSLLSYDVASNFVTSIYDEDTRKGELFCCCCICSNCCRHYCGKLCT